jgi:hypothetical protein
MNKVAKIIIALMACILAFPLAAQETKVVSDLGLWTGVELEKEVNKKWTFSLKEEVRFKTNVSELNNYFTQAGIQYRINRNFALEGKYRFTRDKKSDGSFENRSRYSLDLKYKGRLDFITIDYRLRYQKEVEGMRLWDLQAPYEKYVRNRVSIQYTDLQKLEPFISGEIFQLFEMYQYPVFHFFRIQAGIRYEPGNFGEFKASWGFNREIESPTPATYYMFTVNYTYSF